MIYEYFRVTGAHDTVLDCADFFSVTLRNVMFRNLKRDATLAQTATHKEVLGQNEVESKLNGPFIEYLVDQVDSATWMSISSRSCVSSGVAFRCMEIICELVRWLRALHWILRCADTYGQRPRSKHRELQDFVLGLEYFEVKGITLQQQGYRFFLGVFLPFHESAKFEVQGGTGHCPLGNDRHENGAGSQRVNPVVKCKKLNREIGRNNECCHFWKRGRYARTVTA